MAGLASLGIRTLVLDVTNQEDVVAVKKIVSEAESGKLDVLVNNAFVSR